MREAQYYIKNITNKKITLSWEVGGGCRLSIGVRVFTPPPV